MSNSAKLNGRFIDPNRLKIVLERVLRQRVRRRPFKEAVQILPKGTVVTL